MSPASYLAFFKDLAVELFQESAEKRRRAALAAARRRSAAALAEHRRAAERAGAEAEAETLKLHGEALARAIDEAFGAGQ